VASRLITSSPDQEAWSSPVVCYGAAVPGLEQIDNALWVCKLVAARIVEFTQDSQAGLGLKRRYLQRIHSLAGIYSSYCYPAMCIIGLRKLVAENV
jgi:hypothetical protein